MRNSRADVVAAALRVLNDQGLEFCSMRRVAAEIGVQPSALYHHVPDKQTLLALMADEIVASVVDPGPAARPLHVGAQSNALPLGVVGVEGGDGGGDGGAGQDRTVESLCRDLRRAMLDVRDGADVVATASAYRLGASAVEARLAGLLQARLGGDVGGGEYSVSTTGDTYVVATEGARTLLHFVFGHTQATQMQLQAQEFAALAAGRPADAAADPPGGSRAALDASFSRGIATILAGLRVQARALLDVVVS